MKPAILVVDIQNAWLENDRLRASVEKRINVINQAIRWFRKNKLPVIVICHEDKEYKVIPGARSFEVADIVDMDKSGISVTKRYPNSFCKTGLDSILKKHGCDTVLIVGLSASGCALATCLGAADHDLKSYFVKDGIASDNEDHVRFAEEVCGTIGVDSFDQTLLKPVKKESAG